MPTVRLADGDLNYSLEGPAGAPVLLLSNSLGTDLGMWDTQIPALTAHFRVLRYDTRGHGASLVTPGPYAIGQLGADVLPCSMPSSCRACISAGCPWAA